MKKVLIIDADIKKSRMTEIFNLDRNIFGLSDYLQKDIKLPVYYPFRETKNQALNIDLIPSGRYIDNSSELLSGRKMQALIRAVEEKYDYILIDTAPMMDIVDTLVLGKFVKNVLLVVRPGLSQRQSVAWILQELEQVSMQLLGVVVNAYDITKRDYKNRYRYGYGQRTENMDVTSKQAV